MSPLNTDQLKMTMMMMMIQSHKDKDDHDDDHHHDHGEGLKEETDPPPSTDPRSRQPRISPTLITPHHKFYILDFIFSNFIVL